MARYRTLKPQTFADEKLNECEIPARFLFIGLWCFCDDQGRGQFHPRRIKMEIFPGDDRITPKAVDAWMRDLDRVGVIRIYTVDGQTFYWLPHFLRHQHIDRPAHSNIPPHPQDREPDCGCFNCRVKRGELPPLAKHSKFRPHNYSKVPTAQNVPDFTRGAFEEQSSTRGTFEELSGCSKNNLNIDYINLAEPQNEPPQNLPHLPSPDHPVSKREERRTQQSALDEIVLRMIQLLEIKHNSQLLQAVAIAITMKSRSKECSVEAAAQQIAARAAFVASENPPENWLQWFEDVGYEYVPLGDPRLGDRRIYARPVCGSTCCQEGWEIVRVDGLPVLRRCPDCQRLWKDERK